MTYIVIATVAGMLQCRAVGWQIPVNDRWSPIFRPVCTTSAARSHDYSSLMSVMRAHSSRFRTASSRENDV